ncbi:MAG: TlpA family protein disulfide reductase [Deltaproteobacteria bacterium]
MIRTTLSLALMVLLAGCGEEATVAPEAPSRVEAVTVRRQDPAERFCDVSAPVGEGRPFALPATEGPALPGAGWRWVNVWATWCAPCVEELPLIARFRERMQTSGAAVTAHFLSVDEAAETVAADRAAHPFVPESARLADPASLSTLMASLGLDTGATIPVHVLVDPTGRIRCARSGAIQESDYDTIRAIVAE